MKNTANQEKIFTNEQEFEKLCLLFVNEPEFSWQDRYGDNKNFFKTIKRREESLKEVRPTFLWLHSTDRKISLEMELLNFSLPEKFNKRKSRINRGFSSTRHHVFKEEKGYKNKTNLIDLAYI
jgi:hypothetical protein